MRVLPSREKLKFGKKPVLSRLNPRDGFLHAINRVGHTDEKSGLYVFVNCAKQTEEARKYKGVILRGWDFLTGFRKDDAKQKR